MAVSVTVEFSDIGFCPAFAGAAVAKRCEELGFDSKQFGENHNRSADIFSEMRAAAAATTRLQLLAGPVSFVTRDPGVIASAVAAVQIASDGRAICGISRGDSAVMLAGKRPQRHGDLVRDLDLLGRYLDRQTIAFGEHTSSLEWIGDLPYTRVPVELFCSGPRTITLAAACADRIGLSVGANPARIRWAMELIDESLRAHGRARSDVTVCAYVPTAVTKDRAQGRSALRVNGVAGWAHMSSFAGNDLSAQPEIMRRATARLREDYDYRFHHPGPPADNPNVALIDEEFADWFGIGGPPGYVVERLVELADLGVQCFGMVVLEHEYDAFATQIIPAVKQAALRG